MPGSSQVGLSECRTNLPHFQEKISSNRRTQKNSVKLTLTPLEPHQTNGVMVPRLKHGTTIEGEKFREIKAKEKEKLRQTKPEKNASNQRRWSPVNVTESWSHCLKHWNDDRPKPSKKKLRQTKLKKRKNFVKLTQTPLEPRQRTDSWSHCLKHWNDDQISKKNSVKLTLTYIWSLSTGSCHDSGGKIT